MKLWPRRHAEGKANKPPSYIFSIKTVDELVRSIDTWAPRLSERNKQTGGDLAAWAHNWEWNLSIGHANPVQMLLGACVIMAGIALYVIFGLSGFAGLSPRVTLPVVMVSIYVGELIVIWVTRHKTVQGDLGTRLFHLVFLLESSQSKWRDEEFRVMCAIVLHTVAEDVSRYPQTMRIGSDFYTYKAMNTLAQRKAAWFRSLRVRILAPKGVTTYDDVIAELLEAIELLRESRWYDLPEAEPETSKALQRWQRAGIILLTIALIGALLAVTVYSATIGTAATVVTTILGVIIIGLLSRLGFTPASIGAAIDTVSRVTKAP